MNYYLIQVVLGAGGDDTDQWTNILFVVVMAVFWLVGSLLKARSNQKKQDEAESGRGASPKPYQKIQRPSSRTVQGRRLGAIRPEPIVLEPANKKRGALHRAGRATAYPENQMEGVVEPIEELKVGPMGLTSEKEERLSDAFEEISEKPLFDFDDVDELKRAILHYEILGKPLSLRSPFS